MSQYATAEYVTVTPTEMISAEGNTDKGRHIQVYITGKYLDLLRKAFAREPQAGHLGHAFWHAANPEAKFPCEGCNPKEATNG